MKILSYDIKTGASTFASASIVLETVGKFGMEQTDQTTGDGLLAQAMIPAIVLRAFSSELYLKALAVNNGKKIEKIHKFNQLFKLISDSDKSFIKNFVIEKCRSFDERYSEKEFKKQLNDSSNTFEEWRYFYEHKKVSVDINFLNLFFEALQERTKQLNL